MTSVGALLTLLVVTAGTPGDARLVGRWSGGGEVAMVLEADGAGTVAGEPMRWSATGGVLTVRTASGESDALPYQVNGDVLTLGPPGSSQTLRRAGPTGAPAAKRSPPARTDASPRAVRFNGRPLQPAERQTLERLERAIGRLPDGDYWYDPRTGASGRWAGPALAFLPAGLELGGAVPAAASGGGSGRLTGVFVNGRELHPVDVAGLQGLIGTVLPGRWWVDASANYGLEGGPPMGNLVAIARARRSAGGSGGGAWSRRYEGATPRDNMNLASDGQTTCVSVSGYSRCTGE